MEEAVFGPEDSSISGWLGLQPLQLKLLYAIYRLELDEHETSPKNIRTKFNVLFNRDIARQNVFNILRSLRDAEYVTRKDRKTYGIDFKGIEAGLTKKSSEYEMEAKRVGIFAKEVKNQFKRICEKNPKPNTEYLDRGECLKALAKSIPQMKDVYIISPKFPNIAYNERISKDLKRREYHTALREHIKKRGNNLFYLTAMDLETAYTRALSAVKNPKRAYRDTCAMTERLYGLEAEYPGLKIRYWEFASVNHLFILENHTHGEVFITIEDVTIAEKISEKNIKPGFSGVYIKSKEVSQKAKSNFQAKWEMGTNIGAKEAKRMIELKKRRLKERIGLK